MIDITFFNSKKCVKCGAEKALLVQDEKGVPLVQQGILREKNNINSIVVGGPVLPCYLKLCTNCGYVEPYAQKLVEEALEKIDLRQELAAELLRKEVENTNLK